MFKVTLTMILKFVKNFNQFNLDLAFTANNEKQPNLLKSMREKALSKANFQPMSEITNSPKKHKRDTFKFYGSECDLTELGSKLGIKCFEESRDTVFVIKGGGKSLNVN